MALLITATRVRRTMRSPYGAQRNAGTALRAVEMAPDCASPHPGYARQT